MQRWRGWRFPGPLSALATAALLVACGGGSGGAAADGVRLWQPLPPSPILGRVAASAAWTGSEVITWGGYGSTRAEPPFHAQRSDGAAYDPATRRWRRIARAPSGLRGGAGDGVAWTGREMVVWASNSPDGPAGGAAYDPRTDTWRRLPTGPLGRREGYTSVWTGQELLVFGGTLGDHIATPSAAALRPSAGSWRRLKSFNAEQDLPPLPNGSVWSGREAFVLWSAAGLTGIRPVLTAFDPTTNRLRRISLAKAPVAPATRALMRPVAWTGTAVLFSTTTDHTPSSAPLVIYNPRSGRWKRARPAPCAPPSRYAQIAWIGDGLVVACGTDGLQVYSPRTDRWRIIDAAGPSPLTSRSDSTIVWTGSDLTVWSGAEDTAYNPTPADGASIGLKG